MLDADPDKPNSVILIYSQRLEPADASVNTARSNKIYDNIAILGATTREVNRALGCRPPLLLGQKLAAVAHAGTDVCAPAEPGCFVLGLPLLERCFETFGNFRVFAGEFLGLAYIEGESKQSVHTRSPRLAS